MEKGSRNYLAGKTKKYPFNLNSNSSERPEYVGYKGSKATYPNLYGYKNKNPLNVRDKNERNFDNIRPKFESGQKAKHSRTFVKKYIIGKNVD